MATREEEEEKRQGEDGGGCHFAVRTGGHMSWSGASNIGLEGFTIDLQGLMLETEEGQGQGEERGSDVRAKLSKDNKVVSISAGARWRDVYSVLKPENLTTVGGRVGDVGVGGFLLGGGIGFLSAEHGFGSDNVVNYEVVLSNGSIVHANSASHPSLYWALKMGSTNYGIVTRFDMMTYAQGPVWGGSQFYSIEQAPKLLDKLVKFTEKLDSDPKAFWGLSMAWNPATKDYIIWTLQTYLKPEPYPSPLWDDFAAMVNDSTTEPLVDMMGIKNLVDITEEFQDADPGKHGRSRWLSMTYRPNARFHLDLHTKGIELFEPYHDHPGVHWAVSIQPIPKRFASGRASLTNGGNPSCLQEGNGDLWVMLITTDWLDPADDEVMNSNAETLLKWAEDEARRRGLFHSFIYPNYASGSQSVIERSTDPEALRMIQEIKRVYDPNRILDKLWHGGFKIPLDTNEEEEEVKDWIYDTSRTEL
ncbi:hypothetical protein D9757_009809 [Collybiopsis confluens]|uniref:FAD-binding PCMH-type domain-containing protein n=1 Tax=Collybiopsis confluens TaxID=2823264 RepID=A0A8H5HFM5_9AGAR|nr:hypothetical protein D9757_009809 [Collybiopsis confluens]